MELKRNHLALPILVAVVLLLVGVYFASYFYLVMRVEVLSESEGGIGIAEGVDAEYSLDGEHWIEDERIERLYQPAHWIDRKIRSRYWEPNDLEFSPG